MFCEKCGAQLNSVEGKTELHCPSCSFIRYFNPLPVVVALIPVFDEQTETVALLGVRRGINPRKGEIAFPGGFLEYEEPTEALLREVREETGIDLDRLLDKEKFPFSKAVGSQAFVSAIPNKTQVIMFFQTMEIKKTDINFDFKNEETEEIVLIHRDTPLAFALHEEARDRFFREVDFYENGHHLV